MLKAGRASILIAICPHFFPCFAVFGWLGVQGFPSLYSVPQSRNNYRHVIHHLQAKSRSKKSKKGGGLAIWDRESVNWGWGWGWGWGCGSGWGQRGLTAALVGMAANSNGDIHTYCKGRVGA